MHAWKDAMSTHRFLSPLKGGLLLACIAPWSSSLKKIATSLPSPFALPLLPPPSVPIASERGRKRKKLVLACISAFFESCTRPIIPFIVFFYWKGDGKKTRGGGREGGSGGKFCTVETRKAFVERPSVARDRSIMGHVFWCCANDMVSRTSSMPPLSRTPTLPPFHPSIRPSILFPRA